jgi:hypothetical protein
MDEAENQLDEMAKIREKEERAAEIRQDAKFQADQVMSAARVDADRITCSARAAEGALLKEAEKQAKKIIENAKEEAAQIKNKVEGMEGKKKNYMQEIERPQSETNEITKTTRHENIQIKEEIEQLKEEAGNRRKEVKKEIEQLEEIENRRKEVKKEIEQLEEEIGNRRKEVKKEIEQLEEEIGNRRKEVKKDREKRAQLKAPNIIKTMTDEEVQIKIEKRQEEAAEGGKDNIEREIEDTYKTLREEADKRVRKQIERKHLINKATTRVDIIESPVTNLIIRTSLQGSRKRTSSIPSKHQLDTLFIKWLSLFSKRQLQSLSKGIFSFLTPHPKELAQNHCQNLKPYSTTRQFLLINDQRWYLKDVEGLRGEADRLKDVLKQAQLLLNSSNNQNPKHL